MDFELHSRLDDYNNNLDGCHIRNPSNNSGCLVDTPHAEQKTLTFFRFSIECHPTSTHYVLEGGTIRVNETEVPNLCAAMVREETDLRIMSPSEAEILLVDVLL
jgi:redox-sensitive bicupin YhaK (pirin superfamily)